MFVNCVLMLGRSCYNVAIAAGTEDLFINSNCNAKSNKSLTKFYPNNTSTCTELNK